MKRYIKKRLERIEKSDLGLSPFYNDVFYWDTFRKNKNDHMGHFFRMKRVRHMRERHQSLLLQWLEFLCVWSSAMWLIDMLLTSVFKSLLLLFSPFLSAFHIITSFFLLSFFFFFIFFSYVFTFYLQNVAYYNLMMFLVCLYRAWLCNRTAVNA